MVPSQGLGWNTIENTIKKWMEVIDDLDFLLKQQIEYSFKTGIG
jgi:hypothetical protein